MTTLFKKLQLSETLDEIIILNEPEDFSKELKKLQNITITESLIKVSEADFALVFVTEQKQIQNRIETLYPKLVGDAVLWFAYPKDNSKKYQTTLSKDYGWGVLGDYNLRPVSQLAINKDWSAIRFRKIAFIPKYLKQTDIEMNT